MTTAVREKTGQICKSAGIYRFDGYVDGTNYPSPTADELEIPLTVGEVFPPIRSCNRGCWRVWTRSR